MTADPSTDVTVTDRASEQTASDAPTSSADAPVPAIPAADKRLIATLLIAVFVVILNETIMGVALPRLMGSLDITASTGQWLTTAFLLTMAVVIPTTGFLLQRIDTRQIFILAMGLFSLGTLLAGLAPSFPVLLAARIVQGSGTAIMLPLLMTTILSLVPLQRRGVVMGNVSIAISVAPAIGPTVSGLILEYLPWRFMFLIVLPVALAALVYGALRLTNVGERGRQAFDLVSVLLSIPAFGLIVLGLSRIGESRSAGSLSLAVGFLVVGAVCLLLFGFRQRRLQHGPGALLDLRAFSYPMFSRSVAMLCITMIGLFGVIILLPIYLQTVRGLGSLETGLLLLPGGLLMGLLGPVVGRLFDRYGPKGLSVFGSLVLVAVMASLTRVTAETPVWLLLVLHLSLSLGLACLFTPAFTSALNPLPPYLYSHGSAILNTLQQVAGAAGTALLITVMTARALSLGSAGTPSVAATTGGLQAAFGVAALVSLGAVVLAFTLKRTDGSSH